MILTGGGSGGHITPLLAVADELKNRRPDLQLVYIGQRRDKLADIPARHPHIDRVYAVSAGKFRRYHGEGWRQILDLATILKNIRDGFRLIAGIWQSFWLLGSIRPTGIFIKGGFVGVPVGLAAAMRRIPYITHDSDAVPGLANRIIARWAKLHTVALPKETYHYPANKTITVGVPINSQFTAVSAQQQTLLRQDIGLGAYKTIILVTGGGLGAQRLNEAVVAIAPQLLDAYPGLAIVHVAGRDHEKTVHDAYQRLTSQQASRVLIKGFVTDLYRYSGAADLVITRAGATHLAEFAVQHKACILVPNPQLTGGHQTKNAGYLAAQQAVVVVEEQLLQTDPKLLLEAIKQLLDDATKRHNLGEQFGHFGVTDSAKRLAGLILKTLT